MDHGGAPPREWSVKASYTAQLALELHMKQHSGQLLKAGTQAGDEFERLYLEWIRARWDEGHTWTRSVWKDRP
jgi:hypothetical protein